MWIVPALMAIAIYFLVSRVIKDRGRRILIALAGSSVAFVSLLAYTGMTTIHSA